jgi:citrate lyase subunit beta/citryl-CoA lyase
MLDLEDSVPRDRPDLLDEGRGNIVRAFNELDFGTRLKFFRPRGMLLDPGHEDLCWVIEHAGANLDGVVYPKAESADEIRSIDQTMSELEAATGVPSGKLRIEALIESVAAEEAVFEIAGSSKRLVGLIFGSYDYWASLGLDAASYRFDHPLLNSARARIVKAAASAGVPAIAEMTTNYPTRNKSEEERRAAIDEFRRDALLARDFGFAGKWTGIPEQTQLAVELFQITPEEIDRAVLETRAYLEAERSGRGSTMIEGRMADRATDRLNRQTLKIAYAQGLLPSGVAGELLGLSAGPFVDEKLD